MNRLQGSVNLALGVCRGEHRIDHSDRGPVSLVFDMPLVLGLSDENMALLMLTLFAAKPTLGTGRITVPQGAVHLVNFAVFHLLSAIPEEPRMDPSLNVLGGPLQPCSVAPLTGFFRNGCCDTGPQDRGMHTVCALMTAEFLALSKYLGNDLSTPRPEFGFAGLRPGDRWCLCASRFLQAHEEGAAPKVRLEATHLRTLDIVQLEVLQAHAVSGP